MADTHPQPPQHVSQSLPLARLFGAFLRLGATAFGGPAMIAYIRRTVIEQCRWLDDRTFRDGVALCQTIPGATAMQVSAYVGLRLRGVAGAVASFIGFGLPAFLLMTTLSALYVRTSHLPAVVSAFAGLQAIIVGIIGHATVSFGRTSLQSWRDARHRTGGDHSGADRHHSHVCWLCAGWLAWSADRDGQCLSPSFLLVVGLVPYFDKLRRSLSFNKALNGIFCSFVGLLLVTTVRFAVNVPWDPARTLLASATFGALLLQVEIIWVVLIGTVVSVLVF